MKKCYFVVRFVVKNHGKQKVKSFTRRCMVMWRMEVRMGRHGENIRKRKDGRWEARYTVYDRKKEEKVYHSVYGHTYEEVKAKRDALRRMPEMASGQTGMSDQEGRMPQDILFQRAAAEWLAVIKEKQKPSTYEKYATIYHGYLEIPLGNTALGQITEPLVKKKLSDQALSDSVAKSMYCVLNRILRYSAGKYAVALPDIKKPSMEANRKTVEVFTMAEQAKLLAAVYHRMDSFKLALLLCLFTGLRLGELCALKWSDIDFENQTLSVKRTVQRLYVEGCGTRTSLVETEPKSACSKREIPLQDRVTALLFGFMNDREYVFGGDRPLDPRTLQNHYKRILEEAGVPYKNFHALRHTYATNCMEGGADVKSVSEMLGHADIQVTLNYYMHPSMDTKRRYADSLCAFYAGIHGQIKGQERFKKL